MRTINISELKPGMKFGKPVYIDGVNLLVPENVAIKKRDIDRLIKWDIKTVQTDGAVCEDFEDENKKRLNKLINITFDARLYELYQASLKKLRGIYKKLRGNIRVEKLLFDEIVNLFLKILPDNKNEFIKYIIWNTEGNIDFARSSINCMIMALLIGFEMKISDQVLVDLALSALLHDVGMLKIPLSILQKKGDLTEKERSLIQTHSLYSFKIITKTIGYSEDIGLIVLQHHERWDGKGYPRKLKGNAILLEARIISVADAYEAMLNHRPYRKSMIGYSATREILNDNSRRFDSDILKVFIKCMGIYPIGSIVLLNNACIGLVVNIHSHAPLRPKIKIIIDKNMKKCVNENIEVDLTKEKELFITKAINPAELEKLLEG